MSDASLLTLIDRSRVADGRGFCQRSRYLNYHSGPTGYGIAMKATKLPLITGIGVHESFAPILDWCRQHPDHIAVPPDAVIREAVQQATAQYDAVVAARGYAYLSDQEEVQAVIREQKYLIAGLTWGWCIEVLPEILRRAVIVEVEVDDTYVIGCTCGLGDGVLRKVDHEARGCAGFGWMCRPDFLTQTRLTQELEYHEFKSTGFDGPSFRDKWEVMIQMFAATLDAERRYAHPVQAIYVHGLIKGKREGDYNPGTGRYDGAIRQRSVFCYGYRKPGNPPMEQEEWAASYEYLDSEGRTKRLPKAFQKAGVWELPDTMIAALLERDDWEALGVTRSEVWTKWIPADVRRKQFVLLGPFTRQEQLIQHFVDETLGEEGRWQEGLWQLYDLGVEILGEAGTTLPAEEAWWQVVWPDPRFQSLLDRIFPRSYECRRYGARMRCQFEDVCLQREGWGNPIGSGLYIPRRPHHTDEMEQAVARGLMLPEAGLNEVQED